MGRIFTISTLERETGLSRSTIHFYVRKGVLPRPQKTAASRALYGETHLALLMKIKELKRAGHSLAEITTLLTPDLQAAAENPEDLATQESDRIRRDILRVATEEFEAKGYAKTHISTIIERLGITHQVLYGFFPSKMALLVECFRTFIEWNVAYNEARFTPSSDLGERALWRLFADYRTRELASDLVSHIHAERGHAAEERHVLAERAWESVVRVVVKEFEQLERGRSTPSPVPAELLAYSMVSAHRGAAMRASWDDKWTQEDVLRTHLWLWLAVAAVMNGAVDIDPQLRQYEDLIREIAAREPEMPPVLEEQCPPGGNQEGASAP